MPYYIDGREVDGDEFIRHVAEQEERTTREAEEWERWRAKYGPLSPDEAIAAIIAAQPAIVESMPDESLARMAPYLAQWDGEGIGYATGDLVGYEDKVYRCLQPHTSQPGWNPVDAPSLWAKVLIPDPTVIPEWEQPGSTNPYMKGDKVKHNGKTWVSDIDNNVWEPGVYGWTEVE